MWCGVPVKMGHLGSMIFVRVLLVLLLGPLIKNVVIFLSVPSPPFILFPSHVSSASYISYPLFLSNFVKETGYVYFSYFELCMAGFG